MRRRQTFAALVLLGALLLGGSGCAEAEPNPGDPGFDPLGPSSPAEAVARTARLAGFEEMVVAQDRGSSYVWLRLPALNSAADVEMAWQTGVASLAAGYPSADEYVVEVATDVEHLNVTVPGGDARAAIASDDAMELRESAVFEYLLARDPASELPADSYRALDDDVLHYLDQKNRSNGLVGDGVLLFDEAQDLVAVVAEMRDAVPGVSAVDAGADAASVWAQRVRGLAEESTAENADELAEAMLAESTPTYGNATQMREVYHVVSAVESDEPFGSVLGLVAAYAQLARDSEVTSGAQADAILVAYHDSEAPVSAREVAQFARATSADTDGSGDSDLLPDVVIEANGGEGAVIAYVTSSGTHVVETESWLAYDRADGTRYWLAGAGGQVALTDGSLLGWAFERREAVLVNALDVGVWLEVFPTQ